jgi:hypothetical protein
MDHNMRNDKIDDAKKSNTPLVILITMGMRWWDGSHMA